MYVCTNLVQYLYIDISYIASYVCKVSRDKICKFLIFMFLRFLRNAWFKQWNHFNVKGAELHSSSFWEFTISMSLENSIYYICSLKYFCGLLNLLIEK